MKRPFNENVRCRVLGAQKQLLLQMLWLPCVCLHKPLHQLSSPIYNASYNTPVGDEADTLVDGIIDNVRPEVIATCLMTGASNNVSHTSALTWIAKLDCAASAQEEAPPNTENQAAK
jgi:hypothetical protein